MKEALLVLATTFSLVATGASQKRIKVQVVDSGSAEVDQLVVQLVSRRPAPLPLGGGKVPSSFRDSGEYPNGRYETKAVTAAIQNLKHLGPKAFPFLVKHLDDNRYCYSTVLPSASSLSAGWIDCSVGDAVRVILEVDCPPTRYKFRYGRDGKFVSPPGFWSYVESRGGVEVWARSAANQTRAEILTEFLDWCVEIEQGNGFGSEDEKHRLLEAYAEERKKANKTQQGKPR